jgi:hypothetical protein
MPSTLGAMRWLPGVLVLLALALRPAHASAGPLPLQQAAASLLAIAAPLREQAAARGAQQPALGGRAAGARQATYTVNGLACPEAVTTATPTDPPSALPAPPENGSSITILLPPGVYTVDADVTLSDDSTVCYIGQGSSRSDVTVQAQAGLLRGVLAANRQGAPGIQLGVKGLVVDGGGASRAIWLQALSRLSLEDVTLQNCQASGGAGGAVVAAGAAALSNVALTNNAAGQAGAMWFALGSLALQDVRPPCVRA